MTYHPEEPNDGIEMFSFAVLVAVLVTIISW